MSELPTGSTKLAAPQHGHPQAKPQACLCSAPARTRCLALCLSTQPYAQHGTHSGLLRPSWGLCHMPPTKVIQLRDLKVKEYSSRAAHGPSDSPQASRNTRILQSPERAIQGRWACCGPGQLGNEAPAAGTLQSNERLSASVVAVSKQAEKADVHSWSRLSCPPVKVHRIILTR